MKNHSSPEPAAHSTLWAHFCARTFGKRYSGSKPFTKRPEETLGVFLFKLTSGR